MPGSATLGDNLVDDLVELVDDLRGDLHPAMGVRHWRVFFVRRTWATEKGYGAFTDVETEMLPQPLVSFDLRSELTPAGVDEKGTIKLSEVSLTYTEAELNGQPVGALENFYYLLREGHGQEMRDRYFGLMDPPWPDRINTIGWVLTLIRQEIEDCA